MGYGKLQSREYRMQLFARRDNAFKQVDLLKIDYAPAWAKLEAVLYEGDREMARIAGSGGQLLIETTVTDMEPETIAVENLSMDTEVRLNLRFRGWQMGEG